MNQDDIVINLEQIGTQFGERWVHRGLQLQVKRGEILGIVGGSGAGKTTILRAMLGLLPPKEGTLTIFGQAIYDLPLVEKISLQHQFGVLFQHNALFSSLTVLENIMFPMRERLRLKNDAILTELALLKLSFVGLPLESGERLPAELSGGMQKRAALARALALDPALLFLDEPTAGLDPNNAAAFDELILDLQSTMGLTVVLVTHDLDTLWRITNRVAYLGEGKVIAVAPLNELVNHSHTLIKDFFHGPRGRTVQNAHASTDQAR